MTPGCRAGTAQFVRDADSVSVVDLSSTNGTYVVVAGTDPDEDSPPLTPGVPVVARRRRPGVRRCVEPADPARRLKALLNHNPRLDVES